MVDTGRGVRLSVAELGEGEPVVMVHGWPERGYRVICPDLRGFGGSEAPGTGYDPETFAGDLIALLDALGLDRVRLVGHDWGGYSGFLVALRARERVSAFLACSTPLPWVRLTPRLAAEAWRSWYAVVMAAAGGPRLARPPDLFAKGLA